MAELSELSKTLYIPLVGRIYASRHYPSMIHDPKALGLESSLPEDAATMNRRQNEYTMVSSIARSVNMDRRIRCFLAATPTRRWSASDAGWRQRTGAAITGVPSGSNSTCPRSSACAANSSRPDSARS